MIPTVHQLYPALVNQQVLHRDQVIRTRVISLPSLLEREESAVVCTVEALPDDWRRPLMQYLDNPNGKHDRKTKVHATNYVIYHNGLYRKGEDGMSLLCPDHGRPSKRSQKCTKGYVEPINQVERCDGYYADTVIFGRAC